MRYIYPIWTEDNGRKCDDLQLRYNRLKWKEEEEEERMDACVVSACYTGKNKLTQIHKSVIDEFLSR